jgi:hypothetical protein
MPDIAPRGGTASPTPAARLWPWLLALYLVGVVGDFGWHSWIDLTTGDRTIELHEWLVGLEASLFWPIDLVAQLLLALR